MMILGIVLFFCSIGKFFEPPYGTKKRYETLRKGIAHACDEQSNEQLWDPIQIVLVGITGLQFKSNKNEMKIKRKGVIMFETRHDLQRADSAGYGSGRHR
jgi:hypothetical protein